MEKILEIYSKSSFIFESAFEAAYMGDLSLFEDDLCKYFNKVKGLNLKNDVGLIESIAVMKAIKDRCKGCELYDECEERVIAKKEYKDVLEFVKEHFKYSPNKSIERDVAKMERLAGEYDEVDFIALASVRICMLLHHKLNKINKLN